MADAAALDAERFADDLEAVRKHFGLERVTLVGHSWGAGVAALYAMRYPDRVSRIVLVGPMALRRSELDRSFAAVPASLGPDEAEQLRVHATRFVPIPGMPRRAVRSTPSGSARSLQIRQT